MYVAWYVLGTFYEVRHVRFAVMAEGFVRETVGVWPALDTKDGRELLSNAVLPTLCGTTAVPRWGFGPRLIYVVGVYE